PGSAADRKTTSRGLSMAKTRKQQIEDMLADQPDDPELLYMLAMEHVSCGEDAEAMRWFDKLMAVAPEDAPAHHQAGRAARRLGRISQAGDVLKRGIAVALRKGDDHAAGEMQGLLENLE